MHSLHLKTKKWTASMLAAGLIVSVSAGVSATSANAAASSASCINKIFGPGGKAAGQGVTIKAGMLLAMTGAGAFFGNVMSKGA
jgi:hypothetical protein